MKKKYPIGSPAVNCVYGLMYRWKRQSSCWEHVDAKPIVKLADVKARPVDQNTGLHSNGGSRSKE